MNILAIDIGGTFIKYAVMDDDMSITERGKVPTPCDSRDSLVNTLTSLYRKCGAVDGVAICLPGIVDSETGFIHMGGALRYNDDCPLGAMLSERIPVPIHIENDAKCAAMAEAAAGSLKDVKDGFVLIFGTMVGGGYIKDGKLHYGKHFSAGEVSYIVTDRRTIPTTENVWGNRCGTPRLCAMYASLKGLPIERVDGVMFFEGVNRGDSDALSVLDEYTMEIAVQIFNLQTILDPERFAIGGGISAQPAFLEAIRRNLEKCYATCPYSVPHAEVVNCAFQNDANLYGAMQCLMRKMEKT